MGIVAAGGGYLMNDVTAAAQAGGYAVPEIIEVPLPGADNKFGANPAFDIELALDLQVLAAVAPKVKIVLYSTSDTQEGLAQVVRRAATDTIHRPSVLSISWGSAEEYWSDGLDDVQSALQLAHDNKVTVVAAAGDGLATAGESDGSAHVLYPASSPLVLACGGTSLTLNLANDAITDEVVWNEGKTGTGGGISDIFPIPAYQDGVLLPPSVNDGNKRRGVPDVAIAASSRPGYRILVNDQALAKDGTSAAAPFWAGLIALANAARGRPLGFVNPFLYADTSPFRPIASGDNRVDGLGYDARDGWNACCGLGVPNGGTLLRMLAALP